MPLKRAVGLGSCLFSIVAVGVWQVKYILNENLLFAFNCNVTHFLIMLVVRICLWVIKGAVELARA